LKGYGAIETFTAGDTNPEIPRLRGSELETAWTEMTNGSVTTAIETYTAGETN